MNQEYKVLVLHENDNVATAVADLEGGTEVPVMFPDGSVRDLPISARIPFGHKFAVSDIAEGATILKYGESIGLASVNISQGEHVHVQNVESQRGRGDWG